MPVTTSTYRLPRKPSGHPGDERHKVWDFMVRVFPPYLKYQRATARHIPVVMMTPEAAIEVFRESDLQSS